MAWYAVRCVFQAQNADTYEERITLWRSERAADAITLAESEAREYAATLSLKYLGLAQSYWLPDDEIENGSEVFSLLRDSDLDPQAYLNQFFDTGTEHQRSLD